MLKARHFAFLGLILTVPTASFAFDTAPHFYITGDACRDAGFVPYATKLTQLENWLTDFYTNDSTFNGAGVIGRLHFDNLTTTRKVKIYWSKLVANAKAAFEADANQNLKFRALCHLGITLHALQDFYTHSNWVELHPSPATAYKSTTYFQDVPADNSTSLYTGKYPKDANLNAGNVLTYHGNYSWGLNHDSYSRGSYSSAYVFAYAATRQWLEAIKGWVDAIRPGFFQSMQTYSDNATAAQLDVDLKFLYWISEWVRVPDPFGGQYSTHTDGRWNGEYSGASTLFAPTLLAFKSFTDVFSDAIAVNHYYEPMAQGLDEFGNENDPIPGLPAMPNVTLGKRVVYLRTVSAADQTAFSCDPLLDGRDFDLLADLFARVAFSYTGYAVEFTEACRQITNSGATNWLSLAIIDKTQRKVNVLYRMYDEDGNAFLVPIVTEQFMDIKNGAGFALNFDFDTATHKNSGNINGKYDSANSTFTSAGDQASGRAQVSLYITEYPIEEGNCPQGTIHGRVYFDDYDAPLPSQVLLEIRNALGVPIYEDVVSLNSIGEFEYAFPLPTDVYQLSVKHSHWLRSTKLLYTNDCVTAEFGLLNGDCFDDNEVNIADFAILSSAFNTFAGDPGYWPDADLNGDEGIDIGDFAILSSNYGMAGDD